MVVTSLVPRLPPSEKQQNAGVAVWESGKVMAS